MGWGCGAGEGYGEDHRGSRMGGERVPLSVRRGLLAVDAEPRI